MTTNKKCAHPACSCTAPEGEAYCSVSCKDKKDLTELACQCKHAGCRGAQLAP